MVILRDKDGWRKERNKKNEVGRRRVGWNEIGR